MNYKQKLMEYEKLRSEALRKSNEIVYLCKIKITKAHEFVFSNKYEKKEFETLINKTIKEFKDKVNSFMQFKKDQESRKVVLERYFYDGVQEFFEAYIYLNWHSSEKILDFEEIVKKEKVFNLFNETKLILNYLYSLSDVTGELERDAILIASTSNTSDYKRKKIIEIRNSVVKIQEQLLTLPQKSELRKKTDSIKWNLQKIEEVLQRLSI